MHRRNVKHCRAVSLRKQDPSVCEPAVQMSRHWCVAPRLSLEAIKPGSNTYTCCLSSHTGRILHDLRLSAATQNKSARSGVAVRNKGIFSLEICFNQSSVTVLIYFHSQMHYTYNTTKHVGITFHLTRRFPLHSVAKLAPPSPVTIVSWINHQVV